MAKSEDPGRMASHNDKDAKRLNGRRAAPGIARYWPIGYGGFNTRAGPLPYLGDVHQGRVISWWYARSPIPSGVGALGAVFSPRPDMADHRRRVR